MKKGAKKLVLPMSLMVFSSRPTLAEDEERYDDYKGAILSEQDQSDFVTALDEIIEDNNTDFK